MNTESLKNHIKHLEKKHEILDKTIQEEFQHYAQDEVIKKYKIEKLRLKTEIENVKAKVL